MVLQLHPGWRVECFFDGAKLGEFEVPASLRVTRVGVMVGGRSYETAIYHGPLLVSRGARYR